MITVGKLRKMLKEYPDEYLIDLFVMTGETVLNDVPADIVEIVPITPDFNKRYIMIVGRAK